MCPWMRGNESSCHAFSSLLYQGLNLSVDFHLFLPPFTPLQPDECSGKKKSTKISDEGISLSPLPLSQSKPDQRHSSQRDRHHHRQSGPRHKRD